MQQVMTPRSLVKELPGQNEISVVVFGSSLSAMVAGRSRHPGVRLNYPSVMGRLTIDGTRFRVHNRSKAMGQITDENGLWQRHLAELRPDVLVLHYGGTECLPGLNPLWMRRHLLGWNRKSGKLRDAYWKRVLKLGLTLDKLAYAADTKLNFNPKYRSNRKFDAEMHEVLRNVERFIGCKVVLIEIMPVGSKCLVAPPKVRKRRLDMNARIRKIAEERGHYSFNSDDVLASLTDENIPDGFHLDELGHELMGTAVATFIHDVVMADVREASTAASSSAAASGSGSASSSGTASASGKAARSKRSAAASA